MLWFVSMASVAWACAGLVHEEGAAAEASGAAVLLVDAGDEVEVHYEVTYAGDATHFGWLIPVPGAFVSLDDGDPQLFADLSFDTAPQVTVVTPSAKAAEAGGCRGGAAKDGGTLEGRGDAVPGGSNDLQVVASGFTGTYHYTVLDAADSEALAAWFAEAGWSPGMLGDDLDHYTARGDAFLALTLDNEAGAVEPQQLPPLVIRYAGDQLSFPSVMARHAVDLQRTTVYVQGDSRAEVTDGWAMVDEDTVWGPAEAVPADVLDDYLADLGTQGTWLRTWSGPRGEGHLTRFDLYAPPEQHVADAVFGFDGSDQRQATTVWLEGGGQAAAWFLPLLLLGSLGATQRRR